RHTIFSRDWSSDVCSSDLIPSLEVLEQALLEFPGAIVLVTHDRFMLERIATEYLALDGRGHAHPFASIEQWQQAARQAAAAAKRSEERRVGKECMSQRSAS